MIRTNVNLPLVFLLAVLLAGCSPIVEKPLQEQVGSDIAFTEDSDVERTVRNDFNEAVKFMHEERYEEAITLLGKVVLESQQNSAPYINMAIAYRKTERLNEAQNSLEKAMQINPRHPVTLNEYAILYRETGRYAEARELYGRLVTLYPQFIPVRKNYGILCELYLNDVACATIQYQAYLDANPDDEEVRLWLTGMQQ